MSPRTRPRSALRALFLDFDSTISTPTYLERFKKWAVADDVALLHAMTTDERINNFGGASRSAPAPAPARE